MEVFVLTHRKFARESDAEEILKIGPHLPKLLSNIRGILFTGTQHYYGTKLCSVLTVTKPMHYTVNEKDPEQYA